MKTEHGHKVVDKVTIDQLIGGARSIKSMLWETSLLDPMEGIRFRGYTIPELQEKLPSFAGAPDAGEPLPEALLWLLLCDEVPTKEQTDALTAELHSRAKLPAHVEPMIRSFPKGMHPMTQLSSAILALQTEVRARGMRRAPVAGTEPRRATARSHGNHALWPWPPSGAGARHAVAAFATAPRVC